ncbi:MAG: DMT family transporter [Rubrivivax sp.]
MTRRNAVLLMILVTFLWSIAGVVTRQLEAARSFEVTFWRSGFNALALLALLSWLRGPAQIVRAIRDGGRIVWFSGLGWAAMYTSFMVALTLTTVANVLVTMALGPLITALLARLALGHRLPARTWGAIGIAGAGIAWMYGQQLSGDTRHVLGTMVALAVPVSAAVNWTLLQSRRDDRSTDMLPAVLIGATLSALATLPLAMPFQASAHDLGLLALLGSVQLAVPCLIAVALSRVLPAAEMSLLGLLEVIFGVTWAWLGAGESPDIAVLVGGLLVLAALAGNEWLGMRRRVFA